MNTYEIGGVAVDMTEKMAARWNVGGWTDADDLAARVCLPDEYEQGSSLRDGAIVMHTPKLVKAGEKITMQEAFDRGLHEYMRGMPANLIRENV
jgi:hypothetical protein